MLWKFLGVLVHTYNNFLEYKPRNEKAGLSVQQTILMARRHQTDFQSVWALVLPARMPTLLAYLVFPDNLHPVSGHKPSSLKSYLPVLSSLRGLPLYCCASLPGLTSSANSCHSWPLFRSSPSPLFLFEEQSWCCYFLPAETLPPGATWKAPGTREISKIYKTQVKENYKIQRILKTATSQVPRPPLYKQYQVLERVSPSD